MLHCLTPGCEMNQQMNSLKKKRYNWGFQISDKPVVTKDKYLAVKALNTLKNKC